MSYSASALCTPTSFRKLIVLLLWKLGLGNQEKTDAVVFNDEITDKRLSESSLIPEACQIYVLINYLAGTDKIIPSKCHDSKQIVLYKVSG